MSRSERLLGLLEVLRRYRQPVSGQVLATETGVSLRTLYRDIASLQAQGAVIDGAPGLGYVLRPGFVLPPLMLGLDEIEALVLGQSWVAERGDARLAMAARQALAKITAVLPAELREVADGATLLAGQGARITPDLIDLGIVRRAIRGERKLAISYRDAAGDASDRTVWPFALGFFDSLRVLVAWCELRQDFRHFRTDRIAEATASEERYPRRRAVLLRAWRATHARGT